MTFERHQFTTLQIIVLTLFKLTASLDIAISLIFCHLFSILQIEVNIPLKTELS